jgi:hypothetical protein
VTPGWLLRRKLTLRSNSPFSLLTEMSAGWGPLRSAFRSPVAVTLPSWARDSVIPTEQAVHNQKYSAALDSDDLRARSVSSRNNLPSRRLTKRSGTRGVRTFGEHCNTPSTWPCGVSWPFLSYRQRHTGSRLLSTHVLGTRNTRQKRNGKSGSHGARVQNCSLFGCQASLSHPGFPIRSLNGQRQSGGHWNVALVFRGTSIGLPVFSAVGW